ncbi:ABC transporter permease [Micromonospora sp. PLK6-60]|uniref:ABC transporter permease n=1 Tax=Micromonospora sp. PLK6-60 TaxID=2873383 RepID=UPI001CA6B802|nr:ABC transporter permease [Micromonospora sp. PLK6-60]MBY8875006.1 ABC transporter permease [Micromonospora sp. PLK6-60]
MAAVWPTFVRNWRVTLRAYPWTYFVGTLATGLLTVGVALLAYRAIGGGRVAASFTAATGGSDYLGYVTVGAAALTFTTRMVLWVAKAQITEYREGTLESQLLTPARRLPYLLGVTLQALTTTVVEVAVLLAAAVALGVRLSVPDPLALVAALAAATVAVLGMSVPLSAVMLAAGEAHITQNTLFTAMALLCGFTFPTGYLPDAARWLGEALPVTWALRVLRAATLPGASVDVPSALAVCLALGAAYLAVGLWILPPAERRALQRSGNA